MSHPGNESSAAHDRIVEAAAANPGASPSELAERLPDVSPDEVERVLAGQEEEENDTYPTPEEISERQLRTLQAIAAHPDATQRDIASFLDVTAATVSNRVNSLSGFNWDQRRQFVKEVLDLDSIPGSDRSSMNETNAVELSETTQDLAERVQQLEQRVDALTDTQPDTPFDDPELTRKVVTLCMESEEITDEEEVRILNYLLHR